MKPVRFFQYWNQQAPSCPSQQCLKDQIEIQKPIMLLPQIRCLIKFRIESSIINIDSNITGNIIWKAINV